MGESNIIGQSDKHFVPTFWNPESTSETWFLPIPTEVTLRILFIIGNWVWLPGAHAPGMFKKIEQIEKCSKKSEKIMHVSDDVTHDRVKFRTETTSYAPCAKMTKFWQKIQNFGSHILTEFLSFLHRAHTMSFRCEIWHGRAWHRQVRAWFFSVFLKSFQFVLFF